MGVTVFPKPLDHEVDENAQAESSTSLIVARHNLNLGAFTSANFYALVTDIFASINTSYPLADLALGSIVTGSLVWTNNDSFYYVYTSTSGYGTLQISSTWLIGEAAVNKSTLTLVAFNFHNSSSLAINAISNSAPKAIAKGQYINWNGALRKAKAAIAFGESLSSSNLEDVADGGLNDLNSKFLQFINSVTLINNGSYMILLRGFSSVTKWGAIFSVLGGYDAYQIASGDASNISSSRNGLTYTFTMTGISDVFGMAIRLY